MKCKTRYVDCMDSDQKRISSKTCIKKINKEQGITYSVLISQGIHSHYFIVNMIKCLIPKIVDALKIISKKSVYACQQKC